MLKRKRIVLGCYLFSCLVFFLILPSFVFSYDSASNDLKKYIRALEQKSSRYGWTDIKQGEISWEYYRTTKNKHPLMFTYFGNTTGNCVLFLGGAHGDELPTVYLMLKLAHYVKNNPAMFKDKGIVIAPLVNPDSFLSSAPIRVNTSGVDINKKKDWQSSAIRQWIAGEGEQALLSRSKTCIRAGDLVSVSFNQEIQTAKNIIGSPPNIKIINN